MGLLGTLAAVVLLGAGAYWTSRYGFRQPRGLARGLGAAVLAWTWVTVGLEVLGALGLIMPIALVGWSALGFVVGVTARRIGGGQAANALSDEEPAGWEWEAVVALALVVWAALGFALPSLLFPVKVVSDGPIYHLYFAARWWKAGRIFPIAAPFGETAATYFPAVGDLWFTWLMTLWGGERLAKVGQAPFLLAGAAAAFSAARRVGANSSSAMIAAAWFLTSTPMLLFAFEANVDAIFVAGYLLAVAFFLEYAVGDRSGRTLSLGALAAGGALGAKATAIVFVPPLLAVMAFFVLIGPRVRKFSHLAMLVLLPMVMAGPWFVRNAIRTGNPLYPLHLPIFGKVVLAGWYGREAMVESPYFLRVDDWRALVDILLSVFDPRLVPVWGLALAGGWALRGGRRPLDGWVWRIAAFAVANVALYWLLIPYRTQQRFMLHAVGLASVPLARLLDCGRWCRTLGVFLLGVHLFSSQAWPFSDANPPWDLSPNIPGALGAIIHVRIPHGARSISEFLPLIVTLALGLAAWAIAWAWSRAVAEPTPRRLARGLVVSVVSFALAASLFYPRGVDARMLFYPAFPDYFQGWLVLEQRVGKNGARIAYAGTDLPFFLLGSGLRNEVRYINVDGQHGWLMHDYHRRAVAEGHPTWPTPRPGWDRLHPDYSAWLRALGEERIQILVVARVDPTEGVHYVADPQGFPIERQWAEGHREAFEPIYGVVEGDPRFRVYRLR